MTDQKPILKRSTNPSVNTRRRRKYYIELRDYYSDIYDNAKSDSEKAEALESLNATQAKLDTLISNIIARMPRRKPLL
jgi:hypothetical protein